MRASTADRVAASESEWPGESTRLGSRLPPLLAGVARVDITPPLGTPLAGSCRLRRARKLVDRLSAKALVLEQHGRRCALVTADLVAFDERMVGRLRGFSSRRLGIGLLLCNASHTHGGPDAYNEFSDYTDRSALGARRHYQRHLERKLHGLLAATTTRLQPVTISYKEGRATFGINRRREWNGAVQHLPNPKGFHNNAVAVFRFATTYNKTLATFFSYACHPTTRYDHEISADFPGPAQRLIEKRTGAVALFAQGAAGDIRPNVIEPGTRPLRFRRGAQSEVVRYGNELGREVLRVLRGTMERLEPRLEWKETLAQLPFDRMRSEQELRGFLPPQANEKLHRALTEKIIRRLKRTGHSKALPMEIVLVRLSREHAIIATNHELCNPYVPLFQRLAGSTRVTVLGYTNACRAYVPTRKIRVEGGYEGDWSCCYFGQPRPFHPRVENVVLRAVRQLLGP